MAVNPSWRMMLVVGLAAFGAAAGCGGRPPLKVGDAGAAGQGGAGGGGGQGGGGTSGGGSGGKGSTNCQGLDETTCKATPGCIAEICPTCYGQFAFLACHRGDETPPVCVPPPCAPLPPCSLLDEMSCTARGDCKALSCPNCSGGRTYAACEEQGGPPVSCPAIPCPQPPPCNLLNETSCKTRSDCRPGYCGDCNGTQTFVSCIGPNEGVACPAYACPAELPCAKLDEMTCIARGNCQAEYCNGCQGRTYAGCGDPGTGFACPASPPNCLPVPCANVTDQLSCDARTDCHAVFADHSAVCDCSAPGCCITFNRCADGGKATCSGTPACKIVAPSCGPLYVASHNAMCYDGCVRPTECAP